MNTNNHGSNFRMDAYAGESKKVESDFAFDAMLEGQKQEEEVTPIGVKGESPVSGNNAGSNFRMDAYAGAKKEGPKVESTFAFDAMMNPKKQEEEAAPAVSAKGASPVSGNNAGSTFRMDAYAGAKKEGPKVESTFAYDAMMNPKKQEEEAPAPAAAAKGESPVSGNNAGSNFRMDAYAGEKKPEEKRNPFNFGALLGKKK